MKKIGVITGARSDFGIYLPILKKIQADPQLDLHLFAAASHLSPEFGHTLDSIIAEGFHPRHRIEMLLSSDSPEGVAKSMGLGTIGFAQAYASDPIDLLLALADRTEMLAAVVAALPFNIPIAHIHGGEITEGAIDDAIRHAITKMSHLHFVSTEIYGHRIIQMGEEPWRVITCGAPALDNLRQIDLLDRHTLEQTHHLRLSEPTLLVTFHPVTREPDHTAAQIDNLLNAIRDSNLNAIFTYPNADAHGRLIIDRIQAFVGRYPQHQIAQNLGTQRYFSLMQCAAAMVGNSSSGIIEAASFNLPVVNIGTRQQGRVCGRNVIQVGYSTEEILSGIRRTVSPEFKKTLENFANPYDRGGAADIIVSELKKALSAPDLLKKKFRDMAQAGKASS